MRLPSSSRPTEPQIVLLMLHRNTDRPPPEKAILSPQLRLEKDFPPFGSSPNILQRDHSLLLQPSQPHPQKLDSKGSLCLRTGSEHFPSLDFATFLFTIYCVRFTVHLSSKRFNVATLHATDNAKAEGLGHLRHWFGSCWRHGGDGLDAGRPECDVAGGRPHAASS